MRVSDDSKQQTANSKSSAEPLLFAVCCLVFAMAATAPVNHRHAHCEELPA
jgi:hypothetical protein